jgi:hypothetical protein
MLCDECGKMVCPECTVTTWRGKLLCPTCVEELKAKKAKARAAAAAAPEEGEAEEEQFPIPDGVPRVRPWVALLIGAIEIVVSLLSCVLAGAPRVSVFILPALRLACGLGGIFGKSERKSQVFAGLLLDLLPSLLAFKLGLEAPWIERLLKMGKPPSFAQEEAGVLQDIWKLSFGFPQNA